ncbi:MAG: TPM domain-containing protein [bacterium]|nr:TPM domain-containing protein [bacterium]
MFPLLLLIATLVPVGHVNDFANLLKPETVSSLETTLSNFERETGYEIAIVTIDTLGTDETIETYAEKLFQEWGIGKEKEDNGLLLLIARDDREMRIEVGYGLEPVVTDIESGRIIREVLAPAFKAGNYDGGVLAAVERILNDITTGTPPAEEERTLPAFNFEIIYIGLFLLMFLSSILARSKSWWAGGIIGAIVGWIFLSWIFIIILGVVGLILDYIVSHAYKKSKAMGVNPPWWIGGGGPGSGHGGGFGGFGGGMSGGGGASGKW